MFPSHIVNHVILLLIHLLLTSRNPFTNGLIIYRIRENFRRSNFLITAKWSISNGFIFKFPARPPRGNLRCPDALKYRKALIFRGPYIS